MLLYPLFAVDIEKGILCHEIIAAKEAENTKRP